MIPQVLMHFIQEAVLINVHISPQSALERCILHAVVKDGSTYDSRQVRSGCLSSILSTYCIERAAHNFLYWASLPYSCSHITGVLRYGTTHDQCAGTLPYPLLRWLSSHQSTIRQIALSPSNDSTRGYSRTMHGYMPAPVLCMACTLIVAILEPKCLLVDTSPFSASLSSALTHMGHCHGSSNDHTLVERGPLDQILDRDYSKACGKGEKLWKEMMSAAPEQASGDRINAELLKDESWAWQAGEQPKEDDLKDVHRDYSKALEVMNIQLPSKNTKIYFIKNKVRAFFWLSTNISLTRTVGY
uniref:Uncharacterized protein n=1 Tax=Dothistroma septosporum TaxID=64363 RepID=A7ISJ5_DOTSE|nr:hypothetical protein [Dothistroma septosporum]